MIPYFEAVSRLLALVGEAEVTALREHLRPIRGRGGVVWVLGNGGSNANAGHLALHLRDLGQQAHDLMAESATLTALSNDRAYGSAPMSMLRSMGRPGDALFVLSGSGDSVNVLVALAEARRIGMATLGLLGFGGGAAKGLCNCAIVLPSTEYGPVEDVHSVLLHLLTRPP